MKEKLFEHRFELFFYSLVCILFGSLFFPKELFTDHILPILFLINFLTGIIFFKKNKNQIIFLFALFSLLIGIFLYNPTTNQSDNPLRYIRLVTYFLFYILVTLKIIKQVWNAKTVNKSVIFGLMSGYIALGLLGFFTFFCIELATPGSYTGLSENADIGAMVDELLYFSYITIMTIGYGDISPVSDMAQKASMLFGLIGQFYLVIVTAVVIEKYIRHIQKS